MQNNKHTGKNMNDAQVEVTKNGWRIHNGRICMELARTSNGGITIASLKEGGREWAMIDTEMGVAIEIQAGAEPVSLQTAGYRLTGGVSNNLPGEGVELVLSFLNESNKANCEFIIRCFPETSAFEFTARLTNRGKAPLPLIYRLFPLSLILRGEANNLNVFFVDAKGRHGFFASGHADAKREFDNWIVLEDTSAGESLMVGGDMGAGVLSFSAFVNPQSNCVRVLAGANPSPAEENEEPSAIDLAPNATIETPLVFLALAKGGADDVANEAFRYLKRYVMPEPVPGAPYASCCVWLTVPDSEEILREELQLARRVGFDVFYHDATWVEGSSLVPGMNDWAMGLGTFKENADKFPHGLKTFHGESATPV